MDELLREVQDLRAVEAERNRAREDEFRRARDRQRALLEGARARLAATEKRGDELRAQLDANEKTLIDLETTLKSRTASMGEMFGAVRQVAGDARGVFTSSLVSAQVPGRDEFIGRLAESKRLPNTEDLEKLWFELQREMTLAGRVVTFPTTIVGKDGTERPADVTRIGVFTATSGGNFLRFLPESGRLYELSRQPAQRFVSLAAEFESTRSGIAPVPFDPSRGALLSALIQAPGFNERIAQGGLVGYIIIFAILPIGLLICLERLVYLSIVGSRVKKQLRTEVPNSNNALGRVMEVFLANQGDDTETLELKLDEAVMRETPRLERGLSTIKVFAAVAPLLGLLGTVTGMINTFQRITLFGTGDPKLMAGGISEALVTTMLGLVTAIPLVLLHSLLTSKSNTLIAVLDEQSVGFVAQIAEKRSRDGQ
jgi:biopolymer transport protein ExbB